MTCGNNSCGNNKQCLLNYAIPTCEICSTGIDICDKCKNNYFVSVDKKSCLLNCSN